MTKKLSVRRYKQAGSIFKKVATAVNKGKQVLGTVKHRVELGLQGQRQTISPVLRSYLEKHGDQQIESITVEKKPVAKIYQDVLNTLSLGKYEKTKKVLGYNNVYHNYLIIQLKNGKNIKLEKNATVQINSADNRAVDPNHTVNIANKNLSLNNLIYNAANGDDKFWAYNPRDANCQNFVNHILSRNNIRNQFSKEVQRDVVQPQDTATLLNSLGPLSKVPEAVTALGGIADRVKHGDSIRINKKKLNKFLKLLNR